MVRLSPQFPLEAATCPLSEKRLFYGISDVDCGRVSLFYPPSVARVAVEEKVETRTIETREEVPTKGSEHLHVFSAPLSASVLRRQSLVCSVRLCVCVCFFSSHVFQVNSSFSSVAFCLRIFS